MTTTASWFHAHQDSVKRSEGKSAVGLVSYITGETLKDERTGTWCSRNHPGEVLAWGTIAPSPAPPYLTDNNQLGKAWNDVERSETRKNSLVAIHWNVAASREFTEEDHKLAAREIAEGFSKRYRVIVTYGIHKPTEHGDDRNWHYHFGHNMRRVGAEGFGEKAREIIDQKTFVQETVAGRAMIAGILNKHLARIGSDERVSHLSFVDQGVAKEPTKHLGNKQNQAELKGIPTETGNENRSIRKRNAEHDREQTERASASNKLRHEAEIIDFVVAQLRQMQQGARKVEIPEQQFSERDNDNLNRLQAMGQRRESLAAFDREFEEEQKRLARTASSREGEMQSRANRGDIPDANDRWAKAMHDSYNPRVKPEENMAVAVGLEAEQFRKEQTASRDQEAKETDPAKKKLIEFDRQISACGYMAIGSERCASITGFIVGKADNAISNRDRERATEWRNIGDKLREDRAELKETIDKGIYEEVDKFLKDQTRGWQPTPSQRAEKEEIVKEQFYGLGDREHGDYATGPVFRRDLPPGAQPVWRDLGQDEIMPPGAHYQINLETGQTQVRESGVRQRRPDETEKEARAAREEQTDAKVEAAQEEKNSKREMGDAGREVTAFDRALKAQLDQANEAALDTGRSRSGGMSY
jgi:hypothetical protein